MWRFLGPFLHKVCGTLIPRATAEPEKLGQPPNDKSTTRRDQPWSNLRLASPPLSFFFSHPSIHSSIHGQPLTLLTRPPYSTIHIASGHLGMAWHQEVSGYFMNRRVLVNFRNIGTAGLILGAKRGSAVPILLKLTSRREITRSGYSNPYFGSISAILRVVASDCGWSLPSNSTCPASARRYKSSASSPFPCYWNTTAIRYTVESICE